MFCSMGEALAIEIVEAVIREIDAVKAEILLRVFIFFSIFR